MRNWIRTAVIGAVVATGVDTQPLALEQSGAHFFLSLLSGPVTLPMATGVHALGAQSTAN